MNVRQIVERYLRENGYDGLYNEDAECACEVDNLMPCSAPCDECKPGYRMPCPPECGIHNWHIGDKYRIDLNKIYDRIFELYLETGVMPSSWGYWKCAEFLHAKFNRLPVPISHIRAAIARIEEADRLIRMKLEKAEPETNML